jgi:hypothetical protein
VTAATADRTTGELTVAASVSEAFPVGTGTDVGRSQAAAYAVIIHMPQVAAGRWQVTATLQVARAAAEASPSAPPVTSAAAAVDVVLDATSRSCPTGPGSCAPTFAPGTQAQAAQRLGCAPGACGAGSPVQLSVVVDASAPGDVYVRVTLAASADAQGQGSASADGSASVSDISVTSAGGVGPPPPPPAPPAFAPGLYWDHVQLDARGYAVRSHRALPADAAFLIEVRGLYEYSWTWPRDLADAECAQVSRYTFSAPAWTSRPDPADPDALDLLVDDGPVTWSPAFGSARPEAPECSALHTYQVVIRGTGSTVAFRVKDAKPLDNVGNFVVAIYRLLF